MNKFILIVLALVLIASQAFKTRMHGSSSLSPVAKAGIYSSVTAPGPSGDLVDTATTVATQQLEAAGVQAPTDEEIEAAYDQAVAEVTAAASSAAAGHR